MTEDALFPTPQPTRPRKPNTSPSRRADEVTIHLVLRKSEREALHTYDSKGGAQDLVKMMIDMMDSHPDTGPKAFHLDLDKPTTWRLVCTIMNSGAGGPNDALRKAFRRYFNNGEGW